MEAAPQLVPERDVTWRDDRWQATSASPRLHVVGLERWAGRWVRIRYHAGLFDQMVRPVLHLRTADGDAVQLPLNGALLGVGEWIGRLPDDCVSAAIAPVARVGAFSFALVAITAMPRPWLVLTGLRRRPRMALTALGARLIGARAEARHCLAFAAVATPLDNYAAWRDRRSRAIDLAGFDRPHSAWEAGPRLHIVVRSSPDDASLRATLASLARQSYSRWCVHLLGQVPAGGDDRIGRAVPDARAGDLGPHDDVIAMADAGDIFLPHALAGVVEQFAAAPSALACYGDEEAVDAHGRPALPRLKPGPSPMFERAAGYAGDGAFLRLSALDGTTTLEQFARQPAPLDQLAAGQVVHVRRLLYRRTFRPSGVRVAERTSPAAVTVVIPTRDRPRLLASCLASLRDRTRAAELQLVIVDNGTINPAALALLDEAEREGARVLRAPGPFNYAALCNRGAATGDAPVILFLNNDVTARDPDWLERLTTLALRPEIGAVGARLLFPDGRLQHGGVIVGLGGTALHASRLAPADDMYLGLLSHRREVGAVTGAVLAVERRKFDAVGGFDADAFPILLNDIDLCLRLAARGWCTVYEPAATLIHDESASRGRAVRPLVLHRHERRRFQERWSAIVRDDPAFHPALSLWSIEPALG